MLPWIEKHRPQEVADVTAHDVARQTLTAMMDTGEFPHCIMYGPPGTGKTSLALACARRINGDKYYKSLLLELNASNDRSIQTVRNQIKGFASSTFHHLNNNAREEDGKMGKPKLDDQKGSNEETPPPRTLETKARTGRAFTKIVLLDEADQMTRPAQCALHRIVETYARDVRFIFTANQVNRIVPAIQSCCLRIRFAPLTGLTILPHLKRVLAFEGKELQDPNVLQAIAQSSQGDMRVCLNVAQIIATTTTTSRVAPATATAVNNDDSLTTSRDNDDKQGSRDNQLLLRKTYQGAGLPYPDDLEALLDHLFPPLSSPDHPQDHDGSASPSATTALKGSCTTLMNYLTTSGLALTDVIAALREPIVAWMVRQQQQQHQSTISLEAAKLWMRIGEIDHALAQGSASEEIQAKALVAACHLYNRNVGMTTTRRENVKGPEH